MFKSFQSNISSNYTLAPRPTCTTGAWQVFAATHKKSGKSVSVFVFDRKTLDVGGFDSRSSSASSARKVQSEVVERLKKEASSIARLRHPSVLELAEPVEETRTGLMFATEPVSATLSGLLADKDEEENAEGRSSRRRGGGSGGTSAVELDELEIQKGLQQIAKGLEFLHESAGLVHGNLTPDAIYINGKSDWKIAALGFSGPPENDSKPGTGPPIALSELLYNDPRLPPSVQLNLDYTSPDFVLDNTVSSSADMFSLGLIMIALYNSPHRSPVRTHGNSSTYKKAFGSSSTVPSASNNFLSSKPLPPQLKSQVLPRLITRRAANRMNAREFQQSAFFDNVLVSTLQFLDTLPAKTPNEKSQFMRGLPRILDQFPRSVLEKKLLPGLLEETKDRDLLALILGNVFKIMNLLKNEGQRAFTDRVVPKLREVYLSGGKNEHDSLKEAGLVIILENLSLITENCDGKVFKDDIIPIYNLGLSSPTSAVIDKTMSCLPLVLPKLDFSSIKNELFPVIAAVFAKTSSLMIKVRGLEALDTLCGGRSDGTAGGSANKSSSSSSSILDKYTVQEKVVPLVKAIKTKEPAVMMAALSLFTSISKLCDYDFLAVSLLPIAWSFSLGPLLNLEQFNRYMELIQGISSRIQQEHTRKLRELATNGSSDQINGGSNSNGFSDPNDLLGGGSASSDAIFGTGAGTDDFTALVLGRKNASPPAASSWDMPSRPAAPQPTTSFSSHHAATPSASSANPWASSASPGAGGLSNNSLNSMLQPKQTPSRAITPDSMMGSIPALQPMQPVQPTPQHALSNSSSGPWASPPPPGALTSPPPGSGTSIDWTRARDSRVPTSLQATSYMSAGSAGTPAQIAYGGSSGGGGINSGGFALKPPPGSGGTLNQGTGMGRGMGQSMSQMRQQQQQQQQQQQPKSGLDKYESLI